ncbi:hypothetical protein D770_03585 [Flammeovirgaceae bacterium 311]|nr:hypothetical protein D770_03585 [Flammeovirgaceae bacterium 311]
MHQKSFLLSSFKKAGIYNKVSLFFIYTSFTAQNSIITIIFTFLVTTPNLSIYSVFIISEPHAP